MHKSKENYNWIWQYFKVDGCKARCSICGCTYNVIGKKNRFSTHLIEFHKISAPSKTDENTEENKTNREMKQIVTEEDAADINFYQDILLLNTEENKEENYG
jgi:hypothetical protein